MKKFLSVVLCMSLAGSMMVGCGGSTTTDTSSESSVEDTNTDVDADAEEASGDASDKIDPRAVAGKEDLLDIAIISSPSGVDDGNFNEDNYNGILKYLEEDENARVTAVRENTGDPAASLQAVADIVADYDVLVCSGFQFAGIGTLAEDNPDTKFILVDAHPVDDSGNEAVFNNIYAMTFAEQESAFFVGMAAALESETKKVAVVNGVAYPSNVNYQFGFESGVNYANVKYGTDVEIIELASYAGVDVTGADVGGNYTGDFADVAAGKVLGEALINEGCDIIFVAAGGSGNGVFTAAKETSNVQVIGCDVDQYDDGVNGSENVVLTSALKVMSENVYKQLTEISDVTFEGQNQLLQADTNSTGYASEDGRHQIEEDNISKIEEAYVLVQEGVIIPAANFNGITPEDFPGMDQ